MASIADRLERARHDELLDLTLRNPLVSYRTLKTRGVAVIDERPAEVFRLLVRGGKKLAFLPVTEEQKEALGDLDANGEPDGEQLDLLLGQPDEDDAAKDAPASGEADADDAEAPAAASAADDGAGAEGPAEPARRRLDTKLQTPYTSPVLHKRLLNTYYQARRSIDEEGVSTLYLALGMLGWYESPSSDIMRRAPLVLVPVALGRTSVQGRFHLRYLGEEMGGNLSLRAKLRAEFGIDWPLPAAEEAEGETMARDFDFAAYVARVHDAVAAKDRWRIDADAVALGFFSFTRFLMYEDLDPANWPAERAPSQHPLLRDLLGEGFPRPPGPRIPDDAPLDPHLDPAKTHHVVEADSSQTQALLDVRQGQNLVLQGPPGTGKSQTITNLIAEAIGDGKTVLFVSEKMAALSVVKRNLDAVGLGDACLELHSHTTRKKAVLDELERTMHLGKPKADDFADAAHELRRTRDALNAYAQAVNRPIGPGGVRPYDAFGMLVTLREALAGIERPSLDVPAMASWTRAAYADKKRLVEAVQTHLEAMGVPAEHPFWGSQRQLFLPSEEQGVQHAVHEAQATLARLQEAAQALAGLLRLPPPKTPGRLRLLARAADRAAKAPGLRGLPASAAFWRTDEAEAAAALAVQVARHAEIRAAHDEQLIPEAWAQDLLPVRQALAQHGPKWYRWLFGSWRRAKGTLAGLCRTAPPESHAARLALVDAVMEAQRLKAAIEQADALGAEAFGARWDGTASDGPALEAAARYLAATHAAIEAGDLPEGFRTTLDDLPEGAAVTEAAEAVRAAQDDHAAAMQALAERLTFDPTVRFEGGAPARAQPFDVQARLLAGYADDVARLQDLALYNSLAADLDAAGLAAVRQVADTWAHGPTHLADLFRHRYHTALVEAAMDARPALATFSRPQHEQVIAAFRQLDRDALVHSRYALAQRHYDGLPARQGFGEVGVLLHEFGKKTRHMPLRRLMQRAGGAVQAIKPVFMMSPMSVPKYLAPGSLRFDLVVFDEASQVRPVDAFGALLRGAQAVVVGDDKQLPPTSFFDAATADDEAGFEDKLAGDQESILGLFLASGAPRRMLRFHYRSKHASLIAVSNQAFYDNKLFVFPSPDAGTGGATGLVYHHLPDAVYDRGGSRQNKEEARTVARRVMAHARTRPNQSLGVATFSTAQRDAILDQLEVMRHQDPSCEAFFAAEGAEPFFVKNLESVQGDERDVIFISVGYGRDADGKVSMNFGPLNNAGGERRLNVLITRAKYRCEVFTNLRPGDLDLHKTKARGVEVLKTYLQFAATGDLDLATPTGGAPDSPFEEAVAEALERQGYRVEHQIGQSGFSIDLAVVDPEAPGRYVIGIECDGATYHSARTARDRDRARQAVLESRGWTIHRIWSTDWFRHPKRELARAVEATKKAMLKAQAKRPEGGSSPAESSPGESSENASAHGASANGEDAALLSETQAVGGKEGGSSAPPPNGTAAHGGEAAIERTEAAPEPPSGPAPYRVATPSVKLGGRALHAVPPRELAAWLRAVVRVESPVVLDLAARRILAAAGVSRLGSRIREAITKAAREAERQGWIRVREQVLFDPAQEAVPVRDRSAADDHTRDIAMVPPQEIQEAALQIIAQSFSIDREALHRHVARHLGFQQLGSNIEACICDAVKALVAGGRLAQTDDKLAMA